MSKFTSALFLTLLPRLLCGESTTTVVFSTDPAQCYDYWAPKGYERCGNQKTGRHGSSAHVPPQPSKKPLEVKSRVENPANRHNGGHQRQPANATGEVAPKEAPVVVDNRSQAEERRGDKAGDSLSKYRDGGPPTNARGTVEQSAPHTTADEHRDEIGQGQMSTHDKQNENDDDSEKKREKTITIQKLQVTKDNDKDMLHPPPRRAVSIAAQENTQEAMQSDADDQGSGENSTQGERSAAHKRYAAILFTVISFVYL